METSAASLFTADPVKSSRRPGLLRTTTGLEPYSGPWNVNTAAHLLNRTMFGPTRREIVTAAGETLDAVLLRLLSPVTPPPPPPDPNVPGRDWTNLPFNEISQINYQYDTALKEWWMELMVSQSVSVTEKMTLFWHHNLASQAEVVRDARYLYRQNALFRAYALGNGKELIKRVTLDPAMLIYLNGYLNRIPSPDENYARELLELFTIGKGPQIGEGNYTHFTEEDVKAAARVLTGWTVKQNVVPHAAHFVPKNHDNGDKQFSSSFGNAVITAARNPDGTVNGEEEMNTLIDMIFARPETARCFCRKLYRWFVYYDIDASAEQNVILPLADMLQANNYEMKPVLETLFRSAHFFDANNTGCIIKDPVAVVAGTVRKSGFPLPDPSSVERPRLMNAFCDAVRDQQMDILDPPNVAGWPAFYQTPDYYEIWINTTTLPVRGRWTDSIVNGIRPRNGSVQYRLDPVAYAATMSAPENALVLIDDITADLLPPIRNGAALTAAQKEYLLYGVMGLVKGDEYEWTDAWHNAHGSPPDATALTVITNKLRSVLRFIMRMPEFQLT